MAKRIKNKENNQPIGKLNSALKAVHWKKNDKKGVNFKGSFLTDNGNYISLQMWKIDPPLKNEKGEVFPYGFSVAEFEAKEKNY